MKLIALTKIEDRDPETGKAIVVAVKNDEFECKDADQAKQLIAVGAAITPRELERLEKEAEQNTAKSKTPRVGRS